MNEKTRYAVYEFPCVRLKIGCTDAAIVSVEKTEQQGAGEPCALSDLAARQLEEYFKGQRKHFELPLEMRGTAFQKKVWQALTEIPYGETRSYKALAEAIGSPKAVRAVGGANHRNPLMIIVPCHRVIGANGALVGYGGGLALKSALLELESQNKA